MTVSPSPASCPPSSLAAFDEQSVEAQVAASLLSGVGKAMGSSLGGWVATFIGLGGDTSSSQFQTIEQQLQAIQTQIGSLGGDIANALKVVLLGAAANNVSQQASWIPTTVGALPTETGADLVNTIAAIKANANYLLQLQNNQLGTSPGSSGFIALWIETLTPQFYIDAVQKGVIHQNFDYYQQLQFAMMMLLVEAYHTLTPGNMSLTPPVLPTPPNYELAQQYFNQYYDSIQQQTTLLPFPTTLSNGSPVRYQGPIDGLGCDTQIYDRVNQFLWGTSNRSNVGSLEDFDWAMARAGDPNMQGLLFPPMSLLESLFNANSEANVAAYNYLTGQPMLSTALPDTQSFLNALGFQVAFTPFSPDLWVPCITLETVSETSAWTQLTETVSNPRGPGHVEYLTGYSSNMFYDVVLGHPVTVAINFDRIPINQSNGVFADLQNFPVTLVTYTNYLGASTSDVSTTAFLDAIFCQPVAGSNAPVDEPFFLQPPVASDNGDGTYSVTVAGLSMSSGGDSRDFTQNVFWAIETGTAATISNIPGSIGLLTWTGPGTVIVTAQRGALKSTASLTAPANVPAVETVAANIYPRTFNFNGQAPFNSQIWVQRVLSTGTMVDDDTTNFALAPDAAASSWLKFTDSDGSGTFTINEDAPQGTSDVTLTATDKTPAGASDSVEFPVVISPPAQPGQA